MSPRAAARLATLGFARVYDYIAGKADWGSFNLPLDGRAGTETRAGAHTRRGVPTCRLTEALRGVRERVERAGWDTCFVVDQTGIVVGRLGRSALRREQDVSVEEAMTPGPSTIRPSARLSAMVTRMREQDLANLPVTTSDGRLVGLLVREDAERALPGLDNSQ
ncbi:MAG: CBS domain-containing protein [Gaiellaceae bacterium]